MLYSGTPIGDGETRLVAPDMGALQAVETGETDDFGLWERWRNHAPSTDTMVYFAVERDGAVVGEIFLHDINADERVGMVGYRIFDPRLRGRGIGTLALQSLVAWVRQFGSFDRIFGIARADNAASCRVLEKAGFTPVGRAREDPSRVVHELVVLSDQ